MKTIQPAYLIYGPVGSGKSTYARKTPTERNTIRFAIDEWIFEPPSENELKRSIRITEEINHG